MSKASVVRESSQPLPAEDDDDATSVDSGDSLDSQELKDRATISRRYRPDDGGHSSAYGLAYEAKAGKGTTGKGGVRKGDVVVDYAQYSKQKALEELKHATGSSPSGKPDKVEKVPEAMKNMFQTRSNRGYIAPLTTHDPNKKTAASKKGEASDKAELMKQVTEEDTKFVRSHSDPLDLPMPASARKGKSPPPPSRITVQPLKAVEKKTEQKKPSAVTRQPFVVPGRMQEAREFTAEQRKASPKRVPTRNDVEDRSSSNTRSSTTFVTNYNDDTTSPTSAVPASDAVPLPVPEDEYHSMLQLLSDEPLRSTRTKISQMDGEGYSVDPMAPSQYVKPLPGPPAREVAEEAIKQAANDQYVTDFARQRANREMAKDPVAYYNIIKQRQNEMRDREKRFFNTITAIENLVADDAFAGRLTDFLERYRSEFQRTIVNRQRNEFSVREHFVWKTYAKAMEDQVLTYLERQIEGFDPEEFFDRLLSADSDDDLDGDSTDSTDDDNDAIANFRVKDSSSAKKKKSSKDLLSTDGWQLLLSMLKFEAFNDMMDEYIATYNATAKRTTGGGGIPPSPAPTGTGTAARTSASSSDDGLRTPTGTNTPPPSSVASSSAQPLSSTQPPSTQRTANSASTTSPKPTPPRAPLAERKGLSSSGGTAKNRPIGKR